MAIEIVDFPMKKGDFPWQNVGSPEGNKALPDIHGVFADKQIEVVGPTCRTWQNRAAWASRTPEPSTGSCQTSSLADGHLDHLAYPAWWTNMLPWKDPPFFMGKSTISTGPFSIAFCRFTRGYWQNALGLLAKRSSIWSWTLDQFGWFSP